MGGQFPMGKSGDLKNRGGLLMGCCDVLLGWDRDGSTAYPSPQILALMFSIEFIQGTAQHYRRGEPWIPDRDWQVASRKPNNR